MSKHKRLYPSDMSAAPVVGIIGSHDPVHIPADLLRVAMNKHAAREARASFFDKNIFGEAAWDILLALYIAEGRGYSMKVSDACQEARVPQTTALRWLDYLVDNGLVERRQCKFDMRSIIVSLTPQAARRMNQYLRRTGAILSLP